jgi:hypothetical protein
MVNTKSAPRRELSFHCTGCLKEELARIEAASRSGSLSHTGNWTAGENLDHVARTWEYSFDGWPAELRPNFAIRVIGRLMKKRFTSGKTLPSGFNYGKAAPYLDPRPGCSVEDGVARLRNILDRLDRGEEMHAPSMAFGAMSHEENLRLQLAHAQLHLGFISY